MKNELKVFLLALIAFSALIPEITKANWIDGASTLRNASSGDYLGGGADSRGAQYVIPNEIYPEEAKSIWRDAPQGAYISVGTERGFIGAALSPNVTHLVLIDLVPEIVFYNRINIALMKASDSLDEYLALREAQTHEPWIAAAKRAHMSVSDTELLSSPDFHEKFRALQAEPTRRLKDPDLFVGSSYLKDGSMFERLRTLARTDRIWVGHGNLLDSSFLASVAQRLKSASVPISVLDLSNAWDFHYTGSSGAEQIVKAFDNSMKPDSLLLVTNVRKQLSSSMYEWSYHGFLYSTLQYARQQLQSESALFTLIRLKKLFPSGRIIRTEDLTRRFLTEAKVVDFFRNQPRTANFLIRQIRRFNRCASGTCGTQARSCEELFR